MALLNYIHSLTLLMEPQHFVNTSDMRLAVSRFITWTTEPKSAEVRKVCGTPHIGGRGVAIKGSYTKCSPEEMYNSVLLHGAALVNNWCDIGVEILPTMLSSSHIYSSIHGPGLLDRCRALCRIKLFPVTCFGGHMDVNC